MKWPQLLIQQKTDVYGNGNPSKDLLEVIKSAVKVKTGEKLAKMLVKD